MTDSSRFAVERVRLERGLFLRLVELLGARKGYLALEGPRGALPFWIARGFTEIAASSRGRPTAKESAN